MTKSKSDTVAKVITHLLTDTLPVLVIKRAFSLLSLGRYLLPVTTWNRYQSTGSRGKSLFTTTSRNVTIVRCRMSQTEGSSQLIITKAESVLSSLKILREASVHVLRVIRQYNSRLP